MGREWEWVGVGKGNEGNGNGEGELARGNGKGDCGRGMGKGEKGGGGESRKVEGEQRKSAKACFHDCGHWAVLGVCGHEVR